MSTSAQAAANLANAQHSTGPITDAGKAASSKNALKHGFTAQTVLLPGEDEVAYRKLCEETSLYWKPANEQERKLVELLSITQWRLLRCPRLEAAIFSQDIPDFKAFDVISKHEARLKKQYSSTLKELTGIIADRIAAEEAQMKDAIIIRRADRINKQPSNLKAFGFDFSVEQVDAIIDREKAVARAKNVVFPKKEFNLDSLYGFKSTK